MRRRLLPGGHACGEAQAEPARYGHRTYRACRPPGSPPNVRSATSAEADPTANPLEVARSGRNQFTSAPKNRSLGKVSRAHFSSLPRNVYVLADIGQAAWRILDQAEDERPRAHPDDTVVVVGIRSAVRVLPAKRQSGSSSIVRPLNDQDPRSPRGRFLPLGSTLLRFCEKCRKCRGPRASSS